MTQITAKELLYIRAEDKERCIILTIDVSSHYWLKRTSAFFGLEEGRDTLNALTWKEIFPNFAVYGIRRKMKLIITFLCIKIKSHFFQKRNLDDKSFVLEQSILSGLFYYTPFIEKPKIIFPLCAQRNKWIDRDLYTWMDENYCQG